MPPVNCHENSYNLNEQDSILALRQFELEAYSSTLTALRAEGELNDEKRELLGHLQSVLGITKERHKAEVRRAVNDEKLTSVACSLNRGNPCATEWEKEGRRVMSLPIRPTPITANTELADYIANITAMENRNILLGRYRTDDNEESTTMEDAASQPTWDVVPMKKRKLMNELNKLDASTSTLDLEKYINPPETSGNDPPTDQYVYLPGGGVVCLEPKDGAGSISLEDAFKKLVPGSVEESPDVGKYSVKQFYKSSEVANMQRRFITREEVQHNQVTLKSHQKRKTPATRVQRVKTDHHPHEARLPPPPIPPDAAPLYNFESKPELTRPPLYHPPPLKSDSNSCLMVQKAPVPPEHLYASETSGKSKPYSRPSSWVRKQNLSTPKHKRTTPRPQPMFQPDRSDHPNIYNKPHYMSSKKSWQGPEDNVSNVDRRSEVKSPSHLPEEPKNPIPINEALFSNVDPKLESPQLILRPKFKLPGLSTNSGSPNPDTPNNIALFNELTSTDNSPSEKLQIPSVVHISSGYNPCLISTDMITATAQVKPATIHKVPSTEIVVQEKEGTKRPTVAVSKPAMVQGITSANIIKVSARNVTSNKVIPIVAQLAGTRITKTSPSTPRSKPNIIVVHRPTPSKPKFLEIDGRGGKPSSPIISTEGDTGVKSTTAVIKSVPTKLVSVPANVRKISGSTISSAFPKTVHKVIRKRNLQQVVFKPSTSVITSPSTFPPTTTTTVPTGFNVIKPGYKSPTPTSQKTVCVPKSIKPLMALKSPGLGSPKVVPYPDFQEPSAPIQIPPFSPSLLHPNPQVLMKKHRQRLVTINTSKDRVTPPSSEEGMRDFQ